MAKAAIIMYLTIALLVLVLISQSPKKHSYGRHRHLKLRSSFNFSSIYPRNQHREPVPFDPLVAKFERRREDREWEKQYFEHAHPDILGKEHGHHDSAPGHEAQPEWEDVMDATDEDYLNDEEKFNVTDRLVLLFPKIDVDPADGYISEGELTEWHRKISEVEVMHRSEREMDIQDKNHDGFVSFAEYDPPTWLKNSDVGYETGWWKEEHFNASDGDGDNLLNITEFNDFLHPADSKNPKLIRWLCKEEVRERDTDKDGKVGFKEFFHGLFDMVRNYDDATNSSDHSNDLREAPAKLLFAQLDTNGDGYLSDEELMPVIGKLHPSEHYYAKQQADYIMSQADEDKDGRLSLAEMIGNPYVFYSSVFNDDEYQDEHDEFR